MRAGDKVRVIGPIHEGSANTNRAWRAQICVLIKTNGFGGAYWRVRLLNPERTINFQNEAWVRAGDLKVVGGFGEWFRKYNLSV